jgi:CRISPR-associated protein Csm2
MNNELRGVLPLIITDASKVDLLVEHARQIGKQLCDYPKKEDRLSTSQIRSLFGEVRQIEAQWSMGEESQEKAYRRMVLLKPKMAYRAKKERKQGVR